MNQNPIDFNYQDGLNVYPIQDYIDNAITNDITTTNIYMNDGSILNDTIYYSNDCNLVIQNKKQVKGIYFKTSYNYVQNQNFYGTIIDFTGKLYVYHNYNVLQPTFPAAYYDVENEILQLKADGISTDGQLTILDAAIIYLQGQITASGDKIQSLENFKAAMVNAYTSAETFETFQQTLFAPNSPSALSAIAQSFNVIRSQSEQAYFRALGQGALYGLGIGLGGAVLAYIGSRLDQERTSNAVFANTNLTPTERRTLYETQSNVASNLSNISNFNNSISNLVIFQGFINSNINTPQSISNILTNNIVYNGVNISNVFLAQNGGNMYNNIVFQKSTSGVPTVGLLGGTSLGDRIILQPSSAVGDYPCAIGINLSDTSVWFSASSNYSYKFYNGGTNNLIISPSTMTFTGTINANTLQIGGVNVNTIINNNLYDLVYGDEKGYPSKTYNTSSGITSTVLFSQSVNTQTFTINNYTNGYGIGTYTIYSTFFNTYDTTGTWITGGYNGGFYSGDYIFTDGYDGEWFIFKLPSPILLTKIRFYSTNGYTERSPGEWRCYGSTNNTSYTVITEGSQYPKIGISDYSLGYYDKVLASTFTTEYQYFAICVNKLAGSGNTLAFSNFIFYGKIKDTNYPKYLTYNGTSQTFTGSLTGSGSLSLGTINANSILQNNISISSIAQTTILTQTPNVSKRFMFQFNCSTSILMPNNSTWYKHDIDLRNFTQTKVIANPSSPYRIFSIKLWIASGYFSYKYNGNANVLEYTVYQSLQSQNGSPYGSGGQNIYANGTPNNPDLNALTGGQISLCCTDDFNFISCLANTNGTLVYCIISDELF